MSHFFALFLHLDVYLVELVAAYPTWIYGILFAIVFCETGFVVTPFLPGDSLLFVAGSLAAIGKMNVHVLFAILAIAAILGDTVNYAFGRYLGEKVFVGDSNRFFKKQYLERTHRYFETHGGKTIFLARFMPIVRTFAPFVAGAGHMNYLHFLSYNIIGGLVWTSLFIYGGYFFGNVPIVQENFTLVIMGIVVASIVPGVIEYLRHRSARVDVLLQEERT